MTRVQSGQRSSQDDAVAAFIGDLRARGVQLRVDGESLVVDAARDALTAQDRERLRATKAELIAALRNGAGVTRARRDGPLPLGLVQQRMWLLDHLDPESTANNLPGAWRLGGELRHDAFRRAIEEIVRRHEILRTRIVNVGGVPNQVVESAATPDFELIDLRELDEARRSPAMMARIRAERDTPFRMDRLPLLRIRLFRLSDSEHVLFVLPHHVIWDGWSWDIFHDELSAIYDAFRTGQPSPLPELPFQYADYAAWHRDLMTGPELDRQVAYWRTQLAGIRAPLELPTDHPRPATLSRLGDRRLLDLDPALVERLRTIGREEHATLFMVLLTAYAAWLLRYTGQDDVTIGVPTQDRLEEGAERLIGAFVNTLVIRVRATPRIGFRELLRQVRDTCVAAYDHQDIPFDRLVEELGVERSPNRTPLYQTLFTFQDVSSRPARIGDLAMSQVHVDTGVAPTDVLFGAMVGRERTVALMDFNASLFADETMSRMAGSFAGLLRDAAAQPDLTIDRLTLLGQGAQRTDDARSALFDQPDAGDEAAPLSHLQEGIWFLERATPGSPVHHITQRYRIDGELNVAVLEQALRHVVEAHETLRYRFPESHGVPAIEVAPVPETILRLDHVADEATALERLAVDARVPFDVATGPLLRASLVRTGSGTHLLQLVVHHIAADEASLETAIADLSAAYAALRAGAQPALSRDTAAYRGYARASRDALQSGAHRADLDFWTAQLAQPSPPLTLGSARPAVAASLRADSVALSLEPSVSAALDDAGEDGARAIVVAAVQALLYRYTGERDVSVGVAARVSTAGPRDVGMYLNTTVVRGTVDGAAGCTHLLESAHRASRAALEHRDVPFSKVVEQVRPQRAAGAPLFHAFVSLDQRPAPLPVLEGARVASLFHARPGVQSDIAIYLTREAEGWRGRLDYATDLFERGAAERLAGHLIACLRAVAPAQELPVDGLDLLSDIERSRLLHLGTGRRHDVTPTTILARIAERAERHPDRVAVVRDGRSVTYGELWSRAAAVASALQERGARAGGIVGVAMTRDVDLLVALIGTLRTGAAYLPIDPTYPEERIRWMLEDAAASIVVTDRDALLDLPRGTPGTILLADLERDVAAATPPAPTPDDIAYVIYTSGSTGRPKGVEVPHGALANLVASMVETPGIAEDDVLLAVTTLSFDIAGLELFAPLWAGARVALADVDETHDGRLLARRIEHEAATVMQATPSTWRMLLDDGWSGRLRRILCGGEGFPPALAPRLLARADEVWNMYGPTETTIWSTAYRVEPSQAITSVPIGRPIHETTVYVMDERGALRPEGLEGELWIGGAGVARGYRNREELTAERFPRDPFARGASRAYRTGDRARWRADGALEHLGRMDDQVKVNGHRIELGEVEARLAEHPDVAQAVAAVKEGADGDRRLVAYVVWSAGGALLASELRRYLGGRLPESMVPGIIVQVDAIPLTPNGKVDRNALPNPFAARVETQHVEPRTDAERAVARIWSELLGRDRIGVHDNFFELGGHSLLSIRAVALIEEEFGLRVDPRSMFFQTLEQVAAEAAGNSASTKEAVVQA